MRKGQSQSIGQWYSAKILRWILSYAPFVALLAALVVLGTLADGQARVWHVDSVWLSVSFVLLVAALVLNVILWWQILRRCGQPIGMRLAWISVNRSILFKYIPGKVWVVLGRAGYVHQHGAIELSVAAAISTAYQILSLGLGVFIGSLGVALLWWPPGAVLWLLILSTILWWLRRPRYLKTRFVGAIPEVRRWFSSETIHMPALTGIAVLTLLQWLLLGTAYTAFYASCTGELMQLVALLQPLANAGGILAVVAPGGLGVREGLAVAYLVELDTELRLALGIAVLSRIWFFGAEVLMFGLSYWHRRADS